MDTIMDFLMNLLEFIMLTDFFELNTIENIMHTVNVSC